MNTLLDQDQAGQMQHPSTARDREISLGTTTILGIFFALAMLCAVFFGFGYSLGAKHVPANLVAAAPPVTTTFSGFKPPPGSPLPPAPKPAETVTVPFPVNVPATAPAASSPNLSPNPEVLESRPAVHAVPPTATAAAAPTAVPFSIVQIAAVSHQEDADLIASTLTRRGYAVAIRHEPQDALLHIQLGPFPTKKDAEAMRQRLQADGFNAYIK